MQCSFDAKVATARALTKENAAAKIQEDGKNGTGCRIGTVSPPASQEPDAEDEDVPTAADEASSSSTSRITRKRKRNCLSCLRCHRLKVRCDKELPCGRCKTSGNSRECYYSYNKGRNNEGKFPSVSGPMGTRDDEKTISASWQVQHKVRGSSHWRDLMAKVKSRSHTLKIPRVSNTNQC